MHKLQNELESLAYDLAYTGTPLVHLVTRARALLTRRVDLGEDEFGDEQSSLLERICSRTARARGWISVAEAGWDGDLICHASRADDRGGKEYASWADCCAGEGLFTISKLVPSPS